MYEILGKEKYDEYEEFAKNHVNGTFTQSIRWGECKKDNWEQAVVVSRGEDGKIRGGMAVLMRQLPGIHKKLLYAPRGPIFDYDDEETFSDLVEGAKELAKQEKGFLFKMDPMVDNDNDAFIAMAKKYGFNYDPNQGDGHTFQRRCNYMKPLEEFNGDEEKLIGSFDKRWRYNIRFSARKGVTCEVYDTPEALHDFHKIYVETAKRDDYTPRSEEYLAGFLKALGDYARLYMCYYEGVPLAGGIATNFAGKVCHVYGASGSEYRDLKASHLMHWPIMCWALETGCSVYDFQGIPMDYESGNDHMQGVYEFKKGSKGVVKLFTGEFDLVFDHVAKAAYDLAERAHAVRKKLGRKLS